MKKYSNRHTPIRIKGIQFKSMDDAFQFYGINRKTYYSRIDGGWSIDDAMTTAIGSKPNDNS